MNDDRWVCDEAAVHRHTKRACGLRLAGLVWSSAILLLAAGLPVKAQNEGLDLLMLLDQSGSVTGHGPNRGNDPTARRFKLIELVATQLAESADYDRLRHRIALVSFGSTVRIDWPWTVIQRSGLSEFARKLETLASVEDLGDTDFPAAFEAAIDQFAQLLPTEERRRVVLLITDGIPDQPGVPQGIQLQRLEQWVANVVRETGAALEVAELCPPGCDAWKRFGDLWVLISGGRARRLPPEEERALVEVFRMVGGWVSTRIAGTEPVSTVVDAEEAIILPPYLETVVFDVFGFDSAAEVVAFAPDHLSRPVSIGTGVVEERWLGNAIRTLTIHRPSPGRWIFRKPSPDTKIEIFSRQFFPRGVLLEPEQARPLLLNERAAILYRLFEDGMEPFRELPNYPITLELAVVRPDGFRRHFIMEPAPGVQRAVYRSTRKSVLDLPGRYKTEVEMVARDLDGRRVTVFEDRWSGFTVRDEARQLNCELTVPAPGAEIPLFGKLVFAATPVEVRLACRDEGRPVHVDQAEAAALLGAIRPHLDHRGRAVESALRFHSFSSAELEGSLEGAQQAGVYDLALEVDESLLPPSFALELKADRRRFSRVWTCGHRVQVVFLALVLAAVGVGAVVRPQLGSRHLLL